MRQLFCILYEYIGIVKECSKMGKVNLDSEAIDPCFEFSCTCVYWTIGERKN